MRRLSSFGLFGSSCMAIPTARNLLLRGTFMGSIKRQAVVRALSTGRRDDFDRTDIDDQRSFAYSESFDHTRSFDSPFATPSVVPETLRPTEAPRLLPNEKSGPEVVNTAPPNFGAPGGPGISNKDSILRDVDAALSEGRPPDLEVLLADHLCYTGNAFCKATHVTFLRYGHVAVRYTTKDGVEQVMNILGGNALALPNASMVNFVKPSEYLYGTAGFDTFAQQGGVYNRDFVGVRVERVSEGAIDALHAYYMALQVRSAIESMPSGMLPPEETVPQMGPGGRGRGAARFELTTGRLRSLLAQFGYPGTAELVQSMLLGTQKRLKSWLHRVHIFSFPDLSEKVPFAHFHNSTWASAASDAASRAAQASARASTKATAAAQRAAIGAADAAKDAQKVVWREASQAVQTGNCAQWTSEGLAFAGLLPSSRTFPKSILVSLLESEMRQGRGGNVKIVVYSEIKHAQKAWPSHRFLAPAYVHPLHWMSNVVYSDMREYADAVVEVPPGQTTAVVTTPNSAPRRPPDWLQLWQTLVVFTPPAVMIGLVGQIGPFGPAAAATWLALNWWLQ